MAKPSLCTAVLPAAIGKRSCVDNLPTDLITNQLIFTDPQVKLSLGRLLFDHSNLLRCLAGVIQQISQQFLELKDFDHTLPATALRRLAQSISLCVLHTQMLSESKHYLIIERLLLTEPLASLNKKGSDSRWFGE